MYGIWQVFEILGTHGIGLGAPMGGGQGAQGALFSKT